MDKERTTVGKNYFKEFLSKKENLAFWNQPLASEKLDRLISNPKIQKSIANDKKNQALYAYIEQTIVKDYASLIDLKLREVFKILTIKEFEEPGGFERKEKSSLRQKRYFETRQHLEFFLKHDINQHNNPDAQLNAFRRWIDISNELLKRHCYEGFLLIFVNLQLMAKPNLLEGLPENSRTIYKHLLLISATHKNHAALRNYIQLNSKHDDFFPLLFWYHAIMSLNESISKLEDQSFKLTRLKTNLNDRIAVLKKEKPHSKELDSLTKERNKLRKELGIIIDNIDDQIEQRDKILEDITKAKLEPLTSIPVNLEQTYNQIKTKHTKDQIDKAREMFKTNPKNEPSSQLYKNKLLPSFWLRRGKSADKYWEEVFTPHCS